VQTHHIHIVVIARHYPPLISGGARRVKLLVQALRETGARVSVIAPELSTGEDGIVVKHPSPQVDLSTHNAKMGIKDKIRTHILLPDPDIRWCLRAVNLVLQEWPAGIGWVITTSPPESCHVAGYLIKKKLKCNWMADVRDFWLDYPLNEVRQKRIRRRIEAKIAKFLFPKADIITAVSAQMGDEVMKLSNCSAKHLPNFVEKYTNKSSYAAQSFNPKNIHFVYTGSFSLSDPNRKIDALIKEFEIAVMHSKNIIMHIVGALTLAEREVVARSYASSKIVTYGRVPYEDSRQLQNNADALLLTAAEHTHVIPGKLEEYLNTDLPIICVGNGPWRANLQRSSPRFISMSEFATYKASFEEHQSFRPSEAAEFLIKEMEKFSTVISAKNKT